MAGRAKRAWSELRRGKPGERPSHAEARRFIYQRSSGSLEMNGGQLIDISSLPASNEPAPKLR